MSDLQRLAGEGIQPRPMREKEMNNRERAKQLLGYRIDVGGSQLAKDQPLIEDIEHALDEAENRGFQIGRLKAGKRALDESDKRAMEAGIDAGYKQGKIEGQREMRERAAMAACHLLNCNCKDRIRAIPVEGE